VSEISPISIKESLAMAFVITEPCIGVKDASCVAVCPVDCIYGTAEDEQFYIHPDECIDCGACVAECPVLAIYAEDEVPADQQRFIQINADYFLPVAGGPTQFLDEQK
jgi:ferredoxin